ncbi:MAG: virulence factor BrkB family protein [Gammaproteobacteria bacterium]|nr:virulence factor BrkB family protein [Gammaproteobacteria bacterium]NNJ83321.1 virulence factor BrkB family protein [Gammaproteobacteria bacterium]
MNPFQQPRYQLQRTQDFLAKLFHHFVNDRCPESAGALAYTSLLALVPLMAVGFTLFAAFPAFDGLTGKLQSFVFSNFVPASGKVVEAYIEGFVAKASALTLPGLIALLVTALLSMATIERTFNAIWKVRRRRNFVDAFMVYWAILTVGPLLIGVSLAVSSYVASLPFFSDAARSLGGPGVFLKLLPFLAATLAFALLYAIVPYQRVPPRHAIAGGVVAAVLFELAKKGFALFVTHFPTYEAIYGALAALPIFLIWVYLSWLIILLGAEFTYCLGNSIASRPDPVRDMAEDVAPPQ